MSDPTPLKSQTLQPPPSDIPSSLQHVCPPHSQQCVGFQQSVSRPSLPSTLAHFSLGPFTQLVRKVLLVSNQNSAPVAFKVKTTAPKVSIPLSAQVMGVAENLSAVLRPPQLWQNRTRRHCRGGRYASCITIFPHLSTCFSNAPTHEGRAPAIRQMQGQVSYPKHTHHTRKRNEGPTGYRENSLTSSPNLISKFSSGTFPVAQVKSGKYISRSCVSCTSHQRAKPSRRKTKMDTWTNPHVY